MARIHYDLDSRLHTLMRLREKDFIGEPHLGIYNQADMASLYSETFGLDVYRDAPDAEDLVR